MDAAAHISLSELQLQIATLLDAGLPLPVWVSAEIAEAKVNYSGHCYLELIEKDERSAGGAAKAQARGVIWRSTYARLAPYFEHATGRTLGAGMKVLIKVLVSYHPVYGLSLQISDIDPTYTVGDMERRKREIIARLQSDGVWDMNRERTLPLVVQRVAVISSRSAAGYRDFMRETEASIYAIRTELFEAVMQGAESETSIADAFARIEARSDEFDAVAIIRGGGSTGDLECFNSYLIATYVARCWLPVLTGIGHDKDVSVVDMVACVQLKTPTAVAAWLCDRAAMVDGELERAALVLRRLCGEATHRAELRLQRLDSALKGAAQSITTSEQSRITIALERLRKGVEHMLQGELRRTEHLAQMVEGYAPENILRLGFAVIHAGGAAIGSSAQLHEGDTIRISMADGTLSATINEIERR